MSKKIPLTRANLEEHLEEQISFLERSCNSFDEGFESEAKRLAATIRILVHDFGKNSHSLLGQLGKKGIKFLDSTFDLNPTGGKALHGGLVCVGMGPNGAKYRAMLDELPPDEFKWVDFDTWWNMPVLDYQQQELTRKNIILTACDQDGGAHIDPKLDEAYCNLAKNNSLGWSFGNDKGETQIEGAERVAIRQIAHEILKSLMPGYTKKPKQEGLITLGGLTVTSKPPENAIFFHTKKKIGRNEPRPCGSGNKYKRCHGNR